MRSSRLYLPPLVRDPGTLVARKAGRRLPAGAAASAGRAFFLSPATARWTAWPSSAARSDFTLLVQGSAPRSVLLERFVHAERAVLLGTGTFWEGIDVRGERLSCVIIDKLPFGVPDDPVTQARASALREAGEDPFTALQLPEAITTLKQGAGRLIRDVTDRGVLVIGDRRLARRGYGRAFLRSLPPMPVTHELAAVEASFAAAARYSDQGAYTREPFLRRGPCMPATAT